MAEEQDEDTMELNTGTVDEKRRLEMEEEIFDLESEKAALLKALANSKDHVEALKTQMKALHDEFARKMAIANARIIELSGKPVDPMTRSGSSGGTEEIDPPTITTVVENGEVRRL